MVLNDLGRKLTTAISALSAQSTIDGAALDALLKSVSIALLESDVNVKLVQTLQQRVKAEVTPQLEALAKRASEAMQSSKARQIVQQSIFNALVELVDSGREIPQPRKGRPFVIMMVGLQGAGKTTTCTKLATYYSRRGFKVALVCADTFRAGAFDQLKQNAVRAKVAFYGSYTESDPVVISKEGVDKFKASRFDVIIVDTSGRHRQEAELFSEMIDISHAVQPDSTILVLDGAIGQAAEAQSLAFKEASDFGAIVVTKLDGHAKGGGALSAVSSTQTPIAFIGTGEHLHDLEPFNPKSFISKLLGYGDMQGLITQAQELAQVNPEKQASMREKLQKGEFTVRDFKEQMQTIQSMGPLSKMASMIPGMGAMMGGGGDEEMAARMRRVNYIFDSMSDEELDSDGSLFKSAEVKEKDAKTVTKGQSGSKGTQETPKDATLDGLPREPHPRLVRIARGSGVKVPEIEELLAQHQMFAKMVKKAGGKSGWANRLSQARRSGAGGMPGLPGMGGGMPGLPGMGGGMPDLGAMANMLPPQMRAQLSQPGGMEQMMRSMGMNPGSGGMPDMSALMGAMGGRGGR